MLPTFLRLFASVRRLDDQLREAVDARLRAETQAAEYARERDEAKHDLERERAGSAQRLEKIADILCRRFLGSALVDVDLPDPEIATSAISPKLKPFSATERAAKARFANDLKEFLADGRNDTEI